ncbi:hypothetical protein [Cryobacterium sp. GrIS_2_6]|uniref:hypothetical protein n=1 Tax=Cryobacterium sp. GrIS_2_6 TaxID=3162785 RepID=UPI002DFE8C1F|nr:hypothetical protein [Cryobacterium psychrotolerans]
MVNSGINYEIFMDATQVESVIVRTAELFPRYINSWLVETGTLVKEEVSARAPEGVAFAYGAGLKRNIGLTVNPVLQTADIRPTDQVQYADAIETGSRPHRPPAGPDSALAQWCEMKGLNVWAVAKSIELRGTKAHPYIEPAYDATKETVAERFNTGVEQYLMRMQTL